MGYEPHYGDGNPFPVEAGRESRTADIARWNWMLAHAIMLTADCEKPDDGAAGKWAVIAWLIWTNGEGCQRSARQYLLLDVLLRAVG